MTCWLCAQPHQVDVAQDQRGHTLKVDDTKMMVNGVNWDYYPIGTNYDYVLWDQSDDIIKASLQGDMTLLRDMGANAIRVYTGIPPKWIQYIYEEYGIYTMLNHSFGRYGLMIDENWVARTDYADPKTRDILLNEVKDLAAAYKSTRGLLIYLLGNENNYGLYWEGGETEDFPDEEAEQSAIGEQLARPMYDLMNQAAKAITEIDNNHPVASCNADNLFLDITSQECTDVDIYGTNIYRGASFTDIFSEVKGALDIPILFTEFGADAYNSKELKEDQQAQADVALHNWKEIYAHAAGLGRSGISIGGFTFQFSDGWWKYGQTTALDLHNNMASWANGGYAVDYVKGKNNMNEEWFGICAKAPSENNLLYKAIPRAAYYILQEVHSFDPYQEEASIQKLERHFSKIDFHKAMTEAREIKKANSHSCYKF